MSEETKLPAIPSVAGDIPAQLRGWLQAVKEILEVRDGRRGNELDRFVTLRELVDAEIAAIEANGTRRSTVTSGTGQTDYTPAPVVTGFTATGAYSSIILTWDIPRYDNHSHVEIWRSATDLLSGAIHIGESTSGVYSDACGTDKRFYYWIRGVTKAEVVGPYNSMNGTLGETAPDVAYLLTQLTGQITESQLYQDLAARIDLIDDAGALSATVTERLDTLYSQVELGFTPIDTFNAYVSADAAFAEQVRGLVFVDDSDNRVSALEGVIITQDNDRTNTALRFDLVEANVATNTAAITNEQTARATADSSLASSITALTARVGTAESNITSEQTARANGDSALTSAVNTLSTTVGGHTTSISTQATTINGLSGQYTVKIDNNGMVSGFGLASTATNGTPTAAFGVRADKFWIGGTSATWTQTPSGATVPFVVTTSTSYASDGSAIPAGAYIQNAMIQNGAITNAKILNAAIDNAKISSLSADKVTFGTMSGDRITANSLNADRLVTNTLGAKLALIQEAYVGTANISDGVITSAKIGNAAITNAKIGDYIASSNFDGTISGNDITANGTTGWAVSKNGDAVFSNGVFRGEVIATSGTFSGSITAATIDLDGCVVSGTLSAGVIDVQSLSGESTDRTSPGVYSISPTKPEYTSVRVTLVSGGGGGGSGFDNQYGNGYGFGGAAGNRNTFTINNVVGAISVTVGAGGAGGGGINTAGGTGGASSVTATTTGGVVSYSVAGGAGGSSSVSGNTNFTGASYTAGPVSGTGGGAGQTASGYASGGGGGWTPHSSDIGRYAGGSGSKGYALVEFYNPEGVITRSEWTTLITHLNQRFPSYSWP